MQFISFSSCLGPSLLGLYKHIHRHTYIHCIWLVRGENYGYLWAKGLGDGMRQNILLTVPLFEDFLYVYL